MFYNDEARLDKSEYKAPPKAKHFKCSSCGRKCNHVTTKKTLLGLSFVPEGERWCSWCVTKAEKAVTSRLLSMVTNGDEDEQSTDPQEA